MLKQKTTLMRIVLLAALILPAVAMADAAGTGFDGMPAGQYALPGIVTGDATRVQVVAAADLGGSAPPDASGNVLVVDNRDGDSMIILNFPFDCGGPTAEDICRVEYGFSFVSWVNGAFIGVYTDDDGSYSNPDDWFQPPVCLPPSTSSGDNSEGERDCLAVHSIEFVISPGAVAYLDNFATECEVVPSETSTWGSMKSLYR